MTEINFVTQAHFVAIAAKITCYYSSSMIDELSLQLINEQNEFFFQLKKVMKASVKRFNSIKSIQDYIEKNKRQNK